MAEITEENKEQSQETAITTPDLDIEGWGSRDDIAALSRRIKSMMPGGDKMSTAQAMALAQYAITLDANPFRGEIYGFVSRGRFVLVDGYKLLVRWAKRQYNYSEKYEELTGDELPAGAIGYRCWILRDDQRQVLRDLVLVGAEFQEAFEVAATPAVGVVTKADRTNRQGQPVDPPKGWTWEQVARKRALKNALNLSHGAPSPREIARETWMVGDTETAPEDWQEASPDLPRAGRERLAALSARTRQEQEEWDDLTEEEQLELFQHNRAVLRGEQETLI